MVKLDERLLAAAVVCTGEAPGYASLVQWERRGWLNGIGSKARLSGPTPEGLEGMRALAATLGPVQVDAYAPKAKPASEEPWMAGVRKAARSALGDALADAMWNGCP